MTRILLELTRSFRTVWTRVTAHYYYTRAKRKVRKAQMAHPKAGLHGAVRTQARHNP